MNLFEKSEWPVNNPIGGIKTSETKELTTLPKAAPTMHAHRHVEHAATHCKLSKFSEHPAAFASQQGFRAA